MFLIRALLLVLSIAAALFLALRAPRPRTTFFRLLRVLLSLAFAVEVVGLFLREQQVPNVWLYNLYASLEFVILLWMVLDLYPGRRPILLYLGGFGVASIIYAAATLGILDFLLGEALLVISLVLSTVFLFVLLDLARSSKGPLLRDPYFWFFTGGLLYFGGIIPVLGTWKFLGELTMRLSQLTYWIVILLAIIRYTLTAVACAMASRTLSGTAR
ncbi:MAG TPA: hypothetical protein PLL57_15155 [Flavobacteriales bacterium]|nr:hypothetical protein [Flavobacteriales bacterium]